MRTVCVARSLANFRTTFSPSKQAAELRWCCSGRGGPLCGSGSYLSATASPLCCCLQPVHGARIVSEVVGSEEMFEEWKGEMEMMAGRIKVGGRLPLPPGWMPHACCDARGRLPI